MAQSQSINETYVSLHMRMFKLRRDVAPELITELIAPNRKHGHELTLFRMGIFGAAHKWRRPKKPPPSLKSVTYPTMVKRGTVIPYLEKIQKIYESRDTPSEFC